MTAVRKTTTTTVTPQKPVLVNENPNDPNVRDPEHKHELGGTLGMTIGGIAGGIAAGVAAGATIGGMAGPVGAVVGAAIGGALGGSAGESIAREVNPTAEEAYWEQNYSTRPYVSSAYNFDTYRPAYRYGIDSYSDNRAHAFEDLEPSLRNNWGIARGDSLLEWEDAREAARDAFERMKSNDRSRS